MKTRIISADNPQALPAAAEVLQRGGLIAFPTDTVYGLAADYRNERAVESIFSAKGRDMSKAIAILLGRVEQLDLITPGLPQSAERLAAQFWPGALTLVVSRRLDLPVVLSALPTIGVRMPDHPFALRLLQAAGPLAVTSANRSGAENPFTAQDVMDQLDGVVDLILDGGRCPGGVPSSVVDCTVPDVKILRQGAVSAESIKRVLGE